MRQPRRIWRPRSAILNTYRTSACSPFHPVTRRLVAMAVALAFSITSLPTHARSALAAPAPISDVYSEADMRLYLATLPAIDSPCAGEECALNAEFDARVQRLGARIAAAAYDLHPDLSHRIKQFEFKLAEKKDAGVTSNASGTIMVLRGTQAIGLNDDALAFVLAREMGHVISQHHEENTTTRILLSVAAGILFPALNLFGNSAAVAQATSSATTASSATLATTAASTATSWLGAQLVLNSMKPEQLSEADQVALKLMESMGLSHRDLALALENSAEFHPSNTWSEDFRNSVLQVRSLETAAEAGEPLPEIEVSDPITGEESAHDGTALTLLDSEGHPLPPLQEPDAVEAITLAESTPVDPAPVPTAPPITSVPVPVVASPQAEAPRTTSKVNTPAAGALASAPPARLTQFTKGKKLSQARLKPSTKSEVKKVGGKVAKKATKAVAAVKAKGLKKAGSIPAVKGKSVAGKKSAKKKP